jgi:hypothetical protein
VREFAHGVGSKFSVLGDTIKTQGSGMIVFVGMQNHTAESIKSYEGFDVCGSKKHGVPFGRPRKLNSELRAKRCSGSPRTTR